MREIKFRAWDNVRTKMFSSVFYSYNRKTGIINLDTKNGLIHFSERNAFELMQFTGLKDKNCKEIYEGDILGYKDKRKKSIRVIRLENLYTESADRAIGFEIDDDKEVIGNIYENPELLKEVNNDERY